jgi:uncharacterized protein YggE
MKTLCACLLAVCLAYTLQAQTKNFIDQPYIEVHGNADTLITPDEIYISIEISEKDNRNKVPLEQLETQMYQALKGLGINVEKDLTASDLASNFKSYFLKGQQVLKSKSYMLKVGDAVTATRVFMALEDLGISQSSIDHVDHSALRAIQNIVRSRAVADARARAVALTQPLGQQPGKAIQIVDAAPYAPTLQKRTAGVFEYRAQGVVPQDIPEIDFQKMKVSATVDVKFILD